MLGQRPDNQMVVGTQGVERCRRAAECGSPGEIAVRPLAAVPALQNGNENGISFRTVALHPRAQEILAAADAGHDGRVRRLGGAGQRFRGRTVHLHAVLGRPDACAWHLGILSRQRCRAGRE